MAIFIVRKLRIKLFVKLAIKLVANLLSNLVRKLCRNLIAKLLIQSIFVRINNVVNHKYRIVIYYSNILEREIFYVV
jgi:hypothetical protein